MTQGTPEQNAFVEEARRISVYDGFQRLRTPTNLQKTSEGFAGACPKCGDGDKGKGSNRFSINAAKGVWNCRGCNKGGGDAISLLMEMDGENFIGAVEILTGQTWPGKDSNTASTVDPDAVRERQEERRQEQALQERATLQKERETKGRVQEFFESLAPFKSSLAETYLRNRGVVFMPSQIGDFRFAPSIDYRGFKDRGSKEEESLGEFPALVAAIRNVAGEIIGVHRTYIDGAKATKLRPPGDSFRNKAKKVWGKQVGGHIALGPWLETMAVGEGIETTGSFYQLGIGPDELGIVCAINLGNMTGKSTGTMPHPTRPGTRISNLEPVAAAENSIMILPPVVKRLILLIDGGGDEFATRAKITTAGRHYRSLGLEVSAIHPNVSGDFNDLLLEGKLQ